MISCGSEHTVAFGDEGVFSWGSGDGGRLGHGDFTDRWEPCETSALSGWSVSDVSAGTWHTACVVVFPLLQGAGCVYTWGSGFRGQLGQGKTSVCLLPTLVKDFSAMHQFITKIFCGSHHNAAITKDGELYTWGSNSHRCLGHVIDETQVNYTPHPGHWLRCDC